MNLDKNMIDPLRLLGQVNLKLCHIEICVFTAAKG